MASPPLVVGGFRREVQPRRQHWFLNEKVGFPRPHPRLLLGFQGTKSARREGISSPFNDAGGCTSPQNPGGPSRRGCIAQPRRWSHPAIPSGQPVALSGTAPVKLIDLVLLVIIAFARSSSCSGSLANWPAI